jgi:hypothetical protein
MANAANMAVFVRDPPLRIEPRTKFFLLSYTDFFAFMLPPAYMEFSMAAD